jgi:hypothetical protein
MKTLKNCLTKILLVLFLTMSFAGMSLPVLAQCSDNSGGDCGGASGNTAPTTKKNADCDNTIGSNGKVSQTKVNKCLNQSPIVHDIQLIVNFLSAGVALIVTAVIIVGGIQYSLAGDNAAAITSAKNRIVNGLIALVAFIFTFAFVQWLIPGGVFG